MRRILPALALLALLFAPVGAQVTRLNPLGACAIATLTSSVGITSANCVFSSFTASLAANGNLSVTAVASGVITPGQPVVGTGVPAGLYVRGQSSGAAGGVGTYQTAGATPVAVGSESMTTAGIPPLANYALICAYGQNVNYKSDASTATATPGSGGQQMTAGTQPCIGATTTFSKLRFFQQTPTATLGIDFYNWQ